MLPYIDAFVPCFGLLALGALLKRRLLREEIIWAGIERLIFWVLLPALLVAAIGSVKLGEVPILGMLIAIWVALGLGTLLSLGISRYFGQGHAAMTSVVMGGIRFNNLIGFAVAGAMFGLPGIALGAVSSGLIVPFVQFVSNAAFASEKGFRPWPILRQILTNPLMLACALGFAVAAAGGLPPGVKPLLESLGRASVALGLLAVGAALSVGAMTDRMALQLTTTFLKLVIVPGLTLAICLWLDLAPLATLIAVLFMALPTAATSYVMARAMGGDAPLMAAITSWEHFLSILTLPLWMLAVKAITGLG
ncbi:AEC family transporter [Roseococcus pinisoli]|uniref:AEC family transporter n=1 Tax=Roseococcus pinisoli TaxID=2835040 RepID=A0ABS5QBF1_9PROT|nr:AEC family transporter [Roseococcus pinisoli]